MQIVADRFLCTDGPGEALDVATGERVRLFVEADVPRAAIAGRTAVCDRLAAVRHPLLVPLLDYGAQGHGWFEAYAAVGPVRLTAKARRAAVLHLVRFLRAVGVELTADLARRSVNAVTDGADRWVRPIGVVLLERPALESARTLLEADGPPGTTAIDVVAEAGAGLRTFRLQVARLARLAGFVVLDGRGGAWTPEPARHVCVLEWLPRGHALPAALASAAAGGGRRHVWIRFCREAPPVGNAGFARPFLRLEPMMRDELTAAVFSDPELGPTRAELRAAVNEAQGSPGRVLAALRGAGAGRGAGWVHETPAEYGAVPKPVEERSPTADAGVARLTRAIDAARVCAARGRHARAAHLLARGATALAARGALEAAAVAACDLGALLLDRGQPDRAAAAFAQARGWTRDAVVTLRALIGAGHALYDADRAVEAEALFRTAAAAGDEEARVWLARTLWRRGAADAALAAVAEADSALRSRLLLALGRVEEAAAAARDALAARDTPAARLCDAHVAAAHVHAALRDVEGVRRHMDDAMRAATRTSRPSLRFEIAAARWACLDRCGMAIPAKVRDRLLRAGARLPPRAAATIRAALHEPGAAEPRAHLAPLDLVRHFQCLIDATHDSGDEAVALQLIAGGVLRTLGACSVVIRAAQPNQVAGAAGRGWPGEAALAAPILSGAAAVTRYGVTPEAVVPIGAAGAVVGTLAVRWVAGAHTGWDGVNEVLRVSAVAAAPLVRALRPLEPRPGADAAFPDDLLGRGEAADGVRQAIRRAASAPYPVLVEGESGSGKELVARAIHARGVRRARRFAALNCAALTDDLLEAELFGHARGAFTGAVNERPGLFEDADQGTLFLDEVGELSGRAQAKLLRVLQDGEVRRVGENLSRRVDVRIVAATNRSLEHEVQAGRFRGDLRFRLDVIRIAIPPLRERVDDIPWLAARIWTESTAKVGSRARLGDELIAALSRYDWPGNVRELQNVMASLAVHGPRRGRVPVALLPPRIAQEAGRAAVGFDEARSEFERRFIRAALARAGGRRSVAAEQLGLSRQRLVKIMNRLRIAGQAPPDATSQID